MKGRSRVKENLNKDVVDMLKRNEKLVRDTLERNRGVIIFGDVEKGQRVQTE